MGTVLVTLGEQQWTKRAMHLACATARGGGDEVWLLVLDHAPSPFLLGSESSMRQPTANEIATLHACVAIAEEYDQPLTVQPIQYDTLFGALAQAVQECGASVIFVQRPHSHLPFADHLACWNLRRQVQARGGRLALLEAPEQTEPWMPAVSLKATH